MLLYTLNIRFLTSEMLLSKKKIHSGLHGHRSLRAGNGRYAASDPLREHAIPAMRGSSV
jgi:hypothetical protein